MPMETKYPSQFWNQINDPLPLPGWGYISRTRVRTTRPPCCPRHPVFRYAALNFEPLVERTCRIGRMPLICRFINQRTATAPGRFNLPNQTPNFTIQIDQQTSTPDHDDTRTNPVFHRLLIGQKKSDTHLSCFPAPYEGSGAGLAKPHTDIVVKTKPLHPNPNTKHWEFLVGRRGPGKWREASSETWPSVCAVWTRCVREARNPRTAIACCLPGPCCRVTWSVIWEWA